MTRRALLAATAALAAAGCARLSGAPRPRPVVLTTVDAYGIYARVPHLADRFNATGGGALVDLSGVRSGPAPSPYQLAVAEPGLGHAGTASSCALDAALAVHNFDPAILQPGALDGFRPVGTALVALPVRQFPIAVHWRPDVFAAARIDPPPPRWTLADLEATCAAIQAARTAGRLPDLAGVLVPVGDFAAPWTALPAWWVAFALGHGGTIVADGLFALDAHAMTGVAALVDLLSRYSVSRFGRPPRSLDGFALALDYWHAPGDAAFDPGVEGASPPLPATFGPQWAWARAPVFPARPVVTTVVTGEAITLPSNDQPDAGQLAQATEALLWLYGPQAQALLQPWGAVPVLAAPDAQRSFWALRSAQEQAVGDWANFQAYNRGWPLTPPVPLEWSLPLGLERAIADPSTLPAAVAAFERGANAILAAQRAP